MCAAHQWLGGMSAACQWLGGISAACQWLSGMSAACQWLSGVSLQICFHSHLLDLLCSKCVVSFLVLVHKALFTHRNSLFSVILEYPLSYVVDKAQAIDKDLDPNNLIRYTIDDIIYTKGSKSYQAPQAFNINARDGTISIGTYDYTDYVGGHFTITVQAADVRGEFNETDTMTVKVLQQTLTVVTCTKKQTLIFQCSLCDGARWRS